MQPALGLVCRLRCRYILLALLPAAHAQNYSMFVPAMERAVREIELWAGDLDHLERQPLQCLSRAPGVVLRCDASATAVAAITVSVDGGEVVGTGFIHRALGPWERRASSGLREMLGYAHAVKTLARCEGGRLRGKVVEVVGDSQVAGHVFRKGGSQVVDLETGELELLEALLDILNTASEFGFEVIFRWVPREDLVDADDLSKVVDRTDFGLSPYCLAYVLDAFGPVDIDRFAAPHNAVCERFNSKFETHEAEAADAFAQCWSEGVSFVLPDFHKVDRVLDLIERDDAEVVLVVPEWPHAGFWNRIHAGAWRERVVLSEFFDGDVLVPHAANAGSCFFGAQFNNRILVMRTRRLRGGGVGAEAEGGRPRASREVSPWCAPHGQSHHNL